MDQIVSFAWHWEQGSTLLTGEPVQWAMRHLAKALAAKGIVLITENASITIEVLEAGSDRGKRVAGEAGVAPPAEAEAFALLRAGDRISALGADTRGIVYALTELADRVDHAGDDPFEGEFPLREAPATRVRSMCRAFVSETEDRPWLQDKAQWIAYFDMLVANRFNRFSLSFGMGYDYPYHNHVIADVYLHFPYPYLLSVPGYDVRVVELPDIERDSNLDMLRFIGREAARRGLDFQLALWTQRYDFDDVPNANYTIAGASEDMIGPYCRDAVAMLLREIPDITGLTFRIHVEGGISEGDYDFWRLVFGSVRDAGRPILIDMHAKGLDDTILNLGLETGMPVCVSPKYLAEHMGLAYHPSAIREREYPPVEEMTNREKLSVGSRRFMRQSYGDMLPAGKKWQVVFRVWPGTQRVLTWGDPALAAGYGRSASFAGADGIEWMEPMTFKGRQGTGIRGGRLGFRDPALTTRYDWEKHLLQFRLFGRLSFSPDAGPESWRRFGRGRFGDAAEAVEAALAAASRILPLVTQTHGPSIANNNYWPEIYTNIAVLGDNRHRPYGDDMDHPMRFGTAPTFDPQLFANAQEFVAELIAGEPTRRYTPLDVADWLERFAEQAEIAIAKAKSKSASSRASVRAALVDAGILASLGRFFAGKCRAACWAELFLETHANEARERMIAFLQQAREGWRSAAKLGADAYPHDITFGSGPHLRGSWQVRDGEVERELYDARWYGFRHAEPPHLAENGAKAAIEALMARQPVTAGSRAPIAEKQFERGQEFEVRVPVRASEDSNKRLHYRHVNQAERWRSVAMTVEEGSAVGKIPASHTDSPYHLQYFISSHASEGVSLTPGFSNTISNQPYFLVEQASVISACIRSAVWRGPIGVERRPEKA
jgi:hypothetical protein